MLLHLIPLEGQITALIGRLRQLVRVGRTGTEVDRWSAAEQDLTRRQRVIDQQTDKLRRDVDGTQHSAITPDLRQDWSSFLNSPQMQQAVPF